MTRMQSDTHGYYGPVVPISAATVLDLVDREIAAHPDALALSEPGRTVTYAELDHLADVAAASVQRCYGIGRGDVVAIAVQARADFGSALLGTLRAGADYRPF